jgi:hypothetical protein
VAGELMQIPDFGSPTMDYFEEKRKYIVNFKKAILMVAGAALQKFTDKIQDEQEILMGVSDMLMCTYAAESTMLRVEKLSKMYDENKIGIYKDILDVHVADMAAKINKFGIDLVNYFAKGDEKQGMLMGMKRFTKVASVDVVSARRRIADKLIEDNQYNF